MSRSLVTGAGGFIGSHLTAALAAGGAPVIATDLDAGPVRHLERSGRVECVEGDLTRPEVRERCLEGVDTVFHLAAAHLSVKSSADEYERVNVRGVADLVEDLTRFGVRRLIHTSSVGVHGRLRQVPADENSPCRPELVYEKTKLRGEEVVLDACRSGLSALVLRPVWVYGPGCGRTERLIRAVRRGRFVVAGKGNARRHSIQIEDMVRAYLSAARSTASGEVVIVGDRTAPTVRELVDAIAKAAGAPPPRSVPYGLLAAAAVAAEALFLPLGREPPISRRTLRLFTANTSFDVSKSLELLGFEPAHDLSSGLARTVELIDARDPWRVEAEDYARVTGRTSAVE